MTIRMHDAARLHVLVFAAAAASLSAAFPASSFAQAGSTGGVVGKTEKSATGTSSDTASPVARGSRTAPGSAPQRTQSRVAVTSATYGGNCGAPRGNATQQLAQACNGRISCDYVIDWHVIGDPKPFCGKNYIAEWRCGAGPVRTASVAPEAGYQKSIGLRCDQQE